MGLAWAVVTGGLMTVVSLVLVIRGTDEARTFGGLLGQFLLGYSVSWTGILVGLLWGLGLTSSWAMGLRSSATPQCGCG